MDKEQALFLNVHDRVYKTRRHWDWWFGSEDTWDAVVYLEATLVDKQGIIGHKNINIPLNPSTPLAKHYKMLIPDASDSCRNLIYLLLNKLLTFDVFRVSFICVVKNTKEI